ncbi:ubiquitin carboxyl-terminal hydrolase 20-like [Abrus precatorius]|uniref:Ubiquitin carboxyl-terminal hydrolase n=1 Tax=Abrus precatorius TaxID=3816 RepID=A0A8B8LZH5_ABRPR|nr:ubiquitin carboxyl-terminal hydrolase 20-like [Abrus precatorius]
MCLSLSSAVEVPEDSTNVPSAPNLLSETLDDSQLVPSFPNLDGSSIQSPIRGVSPLLADSGDGIYADIFGEDAPREDLGMSSLFRGLNDDSSSLCSSALTSNSMVSTVPLEASNAPQRDFLFSENNFALSEDGVSASDVSPSRMGAGLLNLGNTCFLNAILQCFTHTVPLVQGLLSCTHSTPCVGHIGGFCVICALRDHVERSLAASGGTLSPLKLVDNLNHFSSIFTRYQQEDAHEFMQCALDKLDRCFVDLKKNNINFEDDNLVEKVFGGRLISKLRCCGCGRISDTYEPLIDLSLEIENVDSLPCALESFTKVENIDAKFRCESCKEEVSMDKQLMLDQTPAVAAFHLKRFKTDGTRVEKIDKHVDFPLELDLQPYTFSNQNNDVPLKYDLFAVVVHIGFSSTSGHYFCFVRSAPDTWHKLDDSKVTKVLGDFVLSQEAYILFYARQGTPWFSSIMESQALCLDPNTSTSPKSVLDVGDSMYKSNSVSISNDESSEVGEAKDIAEPQFDYYCPEGHDFLELNDTGDATHGCGQCPSGSNQQSDGLNDSETTNVQVQFGNKAIMNGSAMFDGNSSIGNAVLDNNYSCQEVVDFKENGGFHPLTPPSSPDSTDKFQIYRDHLKMESHGSCKRTSNKFMGDSERQAAVKYVNKMSGSRKGVFLELVSGQKEALDKKRKKMDSTPYKKSNTIGVRKKSNHTSGSHTVAAGVSR